MAYSIRRAGPEDRGHIEALLAELFPGDDVVARYDWIHLGNPHGCSLVWLTVDDSGEIAACASYFPRTILVKGAQARAALGGDCWVRPKFRRRGIATAMHAQGRAEMAQEGIEVMFGTPTPANETPLLQIGAKNIGQVVRYARPLDVKSLPLAGALLGRGWGSGRLEPLAGEDPRVSEVWRRAARDIEIGTVRDAAFYRWRFSGAPSRRQSPFVITDAGRPIGACALERVEEHIRVVDLLVPHDDLGSALGAIVRHADLYHPQAQAISLRLTEEDGQARRLWRWGFLARERQVFNILLPPGEPRAELFYDPARWLITYADTDLDRA